MSNVSYYNLTGGLNTVQGIGTINQSPKRTESPDMQNVEYHKLGGIQSMLGNKLFGNSNFGSRVTLGYEYVYLNNKYMIVCTADGKVRIYNPVSGSFDVIYTFNSPTNRHSICAFNNGIVISNGVDDLVYYQRGRKQLLTGTVNAQAGSTTVTGSETLFETELKIGDRIQFGEDDTQYEVTEIGSDTQLTIAVAPTEAVVDSLFYLGEISLCHATLTNSEDPNINAPIRGLAMNSYQGRIFVGATDGTLYYSAVGLYNNWDIASDAGGIATFYNDNSDFTALAIWDKYLVLCKRERSYLLDGTNSDTQQWVIQPYSIYTCDSQQSWIDCNGGLYVYSRVGGGIYPMLQRTIYSPNYQGNELSTKIKDSFKYINTALYDYIFPVYHPKKMYLMFYTPMLTGIGSNTVYVYDLLTKSWLLRKVPQNVTIAFRFEEEIYIGTSDGYIYKEFSGLTFNGKPIEFWWKSPWFSFGRGTDYLSTREFRIKISEEQANKFQLRNYRDGKSQFKTRIIDTNRGAFTGLIWDVGYNPNEQNPDYTDKRTSYQVRNVSDNTYCYTPTPMEGEKIAVTDGTPLYEDVNLTNLIGYAGLITTEYSTTLPELADKIQRVANDGYECQYSHKQYIRYTNGTDYLWIPWEDKTPKAGGACKVSKQAGTTIKTYAYAVYYKSDEYEARYLNVDDQPIKIHNNVYTYQARNADGSLNSDLLLFHGNSKTSGMYCCVRGTLLLPFARYSSRDIYETTGEATGDDLSLAMEAGIISVSGTYDIVTTAGTFSNMATPTEDGDTITVDCYSKTDTIELGTPIYADSECLRQIGIGQSNGQLLLSNTEQLVNLTVGNSYYYYTYLYYTIKPTVFEYSVDYTDGIHPITQEVDDPTKINLPDLSDYTSQSITDTHWDEDSWVITNHIVKRFPLPDQFFNTLQIEIYGNATDEAMAIYGFEIDGVELEEVPYR